MKAWSNWDACGHLAAQGIPRHLWDTQVYYRFQLLVPLLTMKFRIWDPYGPGDWSTIPGQSIWDF